MRIRTIPKWKPAALLLFTMLVGLACRAVEQAVQVPTRGAAPTQAAMTQAVDPAPAETLPTQPPGEPPADATAALPAAEGVATAPVGTPAGGDTPVAGEAVESREPLPALPSYTGRRPPQSNGAEVRPPERRAELTLLTNLFGLGVYGADGSPLGTASDFIINTCETYIVYFVLQSNGGELRAIPLETAIINSGVWHAEQHGIQLYLTPEWLADAPPLDPTVPLTPPDWEPEVRAYWEARFRLSGLSTQCKAASGVVYKNAYATQLLGAELRDGLGNPLGVVEEAVLTPETAKLSFFVVNRVDGTGPALVPLAALNIPKEALQPGGEFSLVLLTENSLLAGAPTLPSLEAAADPEAQGRARQHWGL